MTARYDGAATEETVDKIRVVRLGGIHTLWLRTFLYYMKYCRDQYDIVVTEGFGGSRIPRLAPLYVREPIITAWHQVHRSLFAAQYPRVLTGPLNLLERVSAWVHRNTLVQAYTEDWKEIFPNIGFKPRNIFVVPVSIRDDWLVGSTARKIDPPTIIWIGKLRRYKCPQHLIRAMPLVLRRIPEARLTLAIRRDDVTFEEELEQLVKALRLERNVDFRFNISESEKRDLMRSSSVLALPSSVEGFGIVVLEANACGVPVVASSGVPEGSVQDGRNGLRYPFGQIEALSQQLIRMLSDEDLYEELSRNSLDFARQFRWTAVGASYERVLQEALIGRSGHR